MPLIDADVEVIDVLAVLLHRSFVEQVSVGSEEQVEGFLMGVLEDITEVFSHERVTSLQAQHDNAGVRNVVDNLVHLLCGEILHFLLPDVTEAASEAANMSDFEGCVERVDALSSGVVLKCVPQGA